MCLFYSNLAEVWYSLNLSTVEDEHLKLLRWSNVQRKAALHIIAGQLSEEKIKAGSFLSGLQDTSGEKLK